MNYDINLQKQSASKVFQTNVAPSFKGCPITIKSVDVEKGLSALLALAATNAAAAIALINMKKDEITPEETKAIQDDALVSVRKGSLAKMLNIDPHSIDWHIKKERIELDEKGNIDLTNPVNIEFCKTFDKGSRHPNEKPEPTPEEILATVPKEYFITHKMLITDKNGDVDLNNEQNRAFLEKWKNKEISINDYLMSIAGFAKKTGRTELTINRSIANGELVQEENGRIDILRPENSSYIETYKERKDKRNQLLTTKELGQLLGYKSGVGAIQYHKRFNDLVPEPNGRYDITKEPNATFIRKRLNGEEQVFDRNGQSVRKKVSESSTKHTYTTQAEIAKMKDITTATVGHHIVAEHLVIDKKTGHIDLNNPVNAYFISNFKKNEPFVPYGKEAVAHINKVEQGPKVIHVNPKELSKKSIALVTGLTPTPIAFNTEKGRLVLNDNKKYDISDSINAKFIDVYSQKMCEKIDKATPEELGEFRKGLKQYLQPYISREKYIVTQQLLDESPESLPKYIQYSVDKIVDTENLTDNQKRALYAVATEVITDKINESDDVYTRIPVIQLGGKCKLFAFEELLNRI